MMRKEIEAKVMACVETAYERPVDTLSMDTRFKEDLGGASIVMVALTSLIENEIDVLLPLPVVASCKTIGELVDKVEDAV